VVPHLGLAVQAVVDEEAVHVGAQQGGAHQVPQRQLFELLPRHEPVAQDQKFRLTCPATRYPVEEAVYSASLPPREAPREALLTLADQFLCWSPHFSHVHVQAAAAVTCSLPACLCSTSKLVSWYRLHATIVQACLVTGQTRAVSNIITDHQ
jgi:hypothetical protein